MKQRPTSVSVIAWILIAMGVISLITTTVMINNPLAHEMLGRSPIPIPLHYAICYTGLLITIVSGFGMLKGCNWARFLYLTWGIVGFVTGLITSPMKMAMIPGLMVFLVVVFFLFRPVANTFFSPAEDKDHA